MEKFKDMVTDSLKKDVIGALRDFLGEDDHYNVEAMAEGILEVQSFHCKCRSRKCAPHRCWPSIWGWLTIIALLCVIWTIQGIAVSDFTFSEWKNSQAVAFSEYKASVEEKLSALETQKAKHWWSIGK